jgi:hypothetical protein
MNFYDILVDFILLDAFEEVEKPPPPIRAILQNRWISARFRETVRTRILILHLCLILSSRDLIDYLFFTGSRNGTLVHSRG